MAVVVENPFGTMRGMEFGGKSHQLCVPTIPASRELQGCDPVTSWGCAGNVTAPRHETSPTPHLFGDEKGSGSTKARARGTDDTGAMFGVSPRLARLVTPRALAHTRKGWAMTRRISRQDRHLTSLDITSARHTEAVAR